MVFDFEADILVVGTGAAGFSAAITATSRGDHVMMLEKGDDYGGTTQHSGGGFWIPNNRFQREKGIEDAKNDAVSYMARLSYPQLYNPADPTLGLPQNHYDLISTFYDEAAGAVEFLEEIGALQTIQDVNWTGQPQVDYQEQLPENKLIRGRTLFPRDEEGNQAWGWELIDQLHSWADSHGIEIRTRHEAVGIVLNDAREVVGLEVKVEGEVVKRFRARKAVIFSSGGYTRNQELILRFQRGPILGGCAVSTNTGDFIRLGGAIGAALGNMAGAFRSQLVLEAALADPLGINNLFYVLGDSVLQVNRWGKRVMDEKRNYNDRTMVHYVWDPQRGEWTNLLLFMIYDERTAKLWQGYPPLPLQGTDDPAIISGQTMDELADNIVLRLGKISAHTGGFTLAPEFKDNLAQTIARFNGFARTGQDLDFQRGDFAYDREWTTFPPTIPDVEWPPAGKSNYTMYPLSDQGPYHAIILAPGTLDTNGGPIINARAQVLDVNGQPIPGLYGAGNCIAAPSANAYWGGGGTIGPALTFGHIAGLNAAGEAIKPNAD